MDELAALLLDELSFGDEELVVFVPGGILHELPLEAIAERTIGGKRIWARAPRKLDSDGGGRRTVRRGGAGIVLHDGEAATRSECRSLQRLLSSHGFPSRAISTRRALLAESTAPAILHVAAHGVLDRRNWLLNGIRLADGWLGFEHLRVRNVRGSLVFLASCESGLRISEPGVEKVSWMAAAFGAGAREVVLSLWKVDDLSSTAFAQQFYRQWLSGASAYEAAAIARQFVRDRHPHPYSWAAYFAAE